MQIINILLSDKNGGVEQSFVSYCQLLQDLGHNVLAIVKKNALYKKDLEKTGVKITEISNQFGYYDFLAINNIKKQIINFDANLLFCHVGRAIILGRKALGKLPQKIPLIAINHSTNVKRSIGADVILSVNQEILKKTIALGQAPTKSLVMNNFIEFDKKNSFFSPKHFLVNQKITIGALSRIIPEKGLEYLVRSIKILQDQNLDIELKIAGDGESKKELENLVRSLGLQDKIEFLGWISDKDDFFSKIDIFCLPSIYHETFGIVLIEAMKYNCPIIASDDVGPKSIINNEINGILVKRYPLDDFAPQIAASIIKLANNPDLVANIIKNAQDDLIKNYSSLAAKEKMKKIIDIAINAKF
jgi:glycosyltransferase involved in cell wall biosynthesis